MLRTRRYTSQLTVTTVRYRVDASEWGSTTGNAMGCGNRCLSLKLFWALASLGLLAGPKAARAQIPTVAGTGASGQILVRVKDSDGSPMSRLASVTLRSASRLTNSTTNTRDAGQALFTGLHAGDYTVEVSAPGYQTAQQQAIIAADGETEYVEIVMTADLGAIGLRQSPGAPVLAPKALKETEKGLQALQADRLEEAEAHLKRALQLAPSFPDVNYLMGLLWMRRHDTAQARGYLEKTVALAPKHAAALQALGEVEFLQKDYQHAILSLEQSAGLRPNSWRAHWLAGASYFQQGEYKKAQEHCVEALRVGQEKAGSVRFLLGQAQAALGEREPALATLEQFVHEQPNVPQAATARKLMEMLRAPDHPKSGGAIGGTASAAARAASGSAPSGASEASLPPIAPETETNWAPPDVDEEKPAVNADASCALNQVTEAAGARVEELVRNVDRFTATEEMEHVSLSSLGVQISRETRIFNYLVSIRQVGKRGLDVQEYRDGSVSTQHFPAHLATTGLAMLALVFHPYFREEYDFICEGRGQWRGKPAWLVHYRQRDDRTSEMRVWRVNGMSFPVRLKGRAWIDVESAQILAMEADMVRSVPEFRLLRDHQLIEYGPVEFRKTHSPLWLPIGADWYCNFAGQRYHRRHSFSHFLLFLVEDTQRIGKPKGSEQQ